MPYEASPIAVVIFLFFVGSVLGLSFWLGRRAKSASGYFAAHGEIGWFVNGIAFAGDYLSAASFLGICGMIAFYGYDGFLYSIGFLAGWVVALFVIAEPIKRLGKYTFADALSAKFGQSKGITFAAAISTLVVSVFYLIPQMVGAGSLVTPLLGWPHWAGVVTVGGLVITIVTTAGMVSTTWVQFIKGSLLVLFCAVLVVAILNRGIVDPKPGEYYGMSRGVSLPTDTKAGQVNELADHAAETGPLGPVAFIDEFAKTSLLPVRKRTTEPPLEALPYVAYGTPGSDLLLPGGYFKGIRSPNLTDRLDFVSLMLALFCGTAALPHILIRYYTVKDAAAARKSTVTGIIAIGFFYVLTLYIGLGAMVSGNLDPADSNKAAPLLAATFGKVPFAVISAIAFTTVLGTVSGLILAASGAVAHDLVQNVAGRAMTDRQKVFVAKGAAVATGLVAVVLGILFEGLNVGFLVGWAFNVAASANLPALVMLLFWRGTTKQGMVASILVGLVSSVTWLLLTKEAFVGVFGMAKGTLGIAPFSQPGLVTIPLSFLVLVIVSLATRRPEEAKGFEVVRAD